jgi:hypothetical protein
MFKLEFDTDNAAFEDKENKVAEVATILLNIRGRVLNGYTDGKVMDSNGNGIGYWGMDE